MRRVFYNKLVRDGIEEKIRSKGSACEVRTLSDDEEYEQELLKKVAEEASALSTARSREDFLKEYADLMAVLDALTAHLDFSEADIKTAITENVKKKGGFEKRRFLHWSEDDGYKSDETPQGTR